MLPTEVPVGTFLPDPSVCKTRMNCFVKDQGLKCIQYTDTQGDVTSVSFKYLDTDTIKTNCLKMYRLTK